MIIYLEREIFFDNQCRNLYLCNNQLTDEYFLLSSIDQCSCKKQKIVLCKNDHDRCLAGEKLFLKQKSQTNEILMDNQVFNVVLLGKNELKKMRKLFIFVRRRIYRKRFLNM